MLGPRGRNVLTDAMMDVVKDVMKDVMKVVMRKEGMHTVLRLQAGSF